MNRAAARLTPWLMEPGEGARVPAKSAPPNHAILGFWLSASLAFSLALGFSLCSFWLLASLAFPGLLFGSSRLSGSWDSVFPWGQSPRSLVEGQGVERAADDPAHGLRCFICVQVALYERSRLSFLMHNLGFSLFSYDYGILLSLNQKGK
jgi:hypothetical protein